MSDINDATRYLDEDGLLTLADRIEDVYAKKTDVSKSIQATYEQSPTLAAHVADEYLYIKTGSSTHITYKTLTSIAANTELVVGTNVKVFDDTGIPVYVDKVPGAGGGGVQPILRTEYVGTSTRSDQTIDEDRIIYYINKFYKVVKNGGLPASYTIVPATDLEAVSLGTDIPVSVERMPAGAVITAADVSYDDGTVDDALTELNSNIPKVAEITNVTLNSNPYVTPFTHYASVNIPQGRKVISIMVSEDETTSPVVSNLLDSSIITLYGIAEINVNIMYLYV